MGEIRGDNSVLVGSGKPDILGKPMSRRDFLRGMGVAAGSLLLASCGIQTKETEADRLEFRDVAQGDRLLLHIPGSADLQEITINYFGVNAEKTPLTIRMKDGNPVTKPFQEGASVRRKPGEILENTMYKLDRNPELPPDITIGMLKAAGFIYDYFRERDEVNTENLYGIPVIVEAQEILKADNTIPIETNPDYTDNGRDVYRASLDPKGVKEFAPGYALGRLQDGEFMMQGFAPIANAFVRVP